MYQQSMIVPSTFDIVIPLGPNDTEKVQRVVDCCHKNLTFNKLYVISFDDSILINGATVFGENLYPFNMNDIQNIHGKRDRNGWYLQQLLKLYAGFVIPGILPAYLIIDCDTFFMKHCSFIDQNTFCFDTRNEYHIPYFEWLSRLHPSLKKCYPSSGIAHHMIFYSPFVQEMFTMIENHHENKQPFWKLFLNQVVDHQKDHSGASEYELYFTYMLLYKPEYSKIRSLNKKEMNNVSFDMYCSQNHQIHDVVSVHWYLQ
jgi:hypothetical protein